MQSILMLLLKALATIPVSRATTTTPNIAVIAAIPFPNTVIGLTSP